jgi:uncharacterized protein DUF5675
MRAQLLRFADSPFGVFGYLDLWDTDPGDPRMEKRVARFVTGEDDWLNNLVGKSCIPAGRYRCRRTVWQKTGVPTFEITGVPNRSRILFHWGNTEENVEGCVMVGEDFGAFEVSDEDATPPVRRLKWAIAAGSRRAFDRFMRALHEEAEFPLDVIWAPPGTWRVAG